MSDVTQEIQLFVDGWQEEQGNGKIAFLRLKSCVDSLKNIEIEFIQRVGLTSSLRIRHLQQKEKPLFVMVDVIEGEPRWLSVCFYAQMITDPEERGDFVPQGLLGEDAICFDVESDSGLDYLEKRILEAHTAAQIC